MAVAEGDAIPKWDKSKFLLHLRSEIETHFPNEDLSKLEIAIRNSSIELFQSKSYTITLSSKNLIESIQSVTDYFCKKFSMDDKNTNEIQSKIRNSMAQNGLDLAHVFVPFVSDIPFYTTLNSDEIEIAYGTVYAHLVTECKPYYVFLSKTKHIFTISADYAIFVWNNTRKTLRYNFSKEHIFKI